MYTGSKFCTRLISTEFTGHKLEARTMTTNFVFRFAHGKITNVYARVNFALFRFQRQVKWYSHNRRFSLAKALGEIRRLRLEVLRDKIGMRTSHNIRHSSCTSQVLLQILLVFLCYRLSSQTELFLERRF